jgi:hypothetical protein
MNRFAYTLVNVALLAAIFAGHATHARAESPRVSAHAISVPKGEGTLAGMGESFSAGSSTGTLTYTVPVALPAGRGGLTPSLALSYDSSSGNGLLGIGWDLGVLAISRQTDKGIPSYKDSASNFTVPSLARAVYESRFDNR